MPIKEKEKKEAFRQMDKPSKGDRMADEIREELKEAGDTQSDITRQKGAEAREVIDSRTMAAEKGASLTVRSRSQNHSNDNPLTNN